MCSVPLLAPPFQRPEERYLIEQRAAPSSSLGRLRQMVRRRRLRRRHTKTWKETHDREFRRKYRRIKRLNARRVSHGVRLSIDEFGPRNPPSDGKHYG